MTQREEEVRDKAVIIWTGAYCFKRDRWPQARCIRYADKKAERYIFNNLRR